MRKTNTNISRVRKYVRVFKADGSATVDSYGKVESEFDALRASRAVLCRLAKPLKPAVIRVKAAVILLVDTF